MGRSASCGKRQSWEQGLLAGVDREILQVNEESMWFGGAVNRNNPDSRKNLPVIRELLDKGEISRAEKLMDEALSGCPEGMHAYQTLGEVPALFLNNLLVPGVKKKWKSHGKTTLSPGDGGVSQKSESRGCSMQNRLPYGKLPL